MENKRAIYGMRLSAARRMRGLSMQGLCDKADGVVTKQMVSRYESGNTMPDSTVFIALAKALELPFDYFVTPCSVTLDKVEFRKKSRLGKLKQEKISELVKDQLERNLEIETLLGIQRNVDLSKASVRCRADAQREADKLRKAWGLGEDGIMGLPAMLERHGVIIIEIAADDNFDGECGFANGRPFIVVNKHFTSERARFTILHELGHLTLEFGNAEHKEVELLCNIFASDMLISEKCFKEKIGDKRHDISLVELRSIQRDFGISPEALMFKAKEYGVISPNRYKTFNIKKNKDKALLKDVREQLFPRESPCEFNRMVYRGLATEMITASKAAALLRCSIQEVEQELELV